MVSMIPVSAMPPIQVSIMAGRIFWSSADSHSVVGALIPYMESYYHISYSIMSLVFVGNAVGFISAAFFTDTILGKIGRAKTLVSAETTQLSACIILVCTPPYPLVVISQVAKRLL